MGAWHCMAESCMEQRECALCCYAGLTLSLIKYACIPSPVHISQLCSNPITDLLLATKATAAFFSWLPCTLYSTNNQEERGSQWCLSCCEVIVRMWWYVRVAQRRERP